MGTDMTAHAVCNGDPNDPANYLTFDDFVAGASRVWSLEGLAERWNAAHFDDRVQVVAPIASDPAPSRSCGITRVFAGLQLLGGGLEVIVAGGALLAPEPTGATKVVGVIVLAHGIDTLQASVRSMISCDRTPTFTQAGATSVARFGGASPRTAETIGVITDVGVGVGGSFAVGALSRVGPGAAQLVHLTTTDSAAAIRASQTLGLGRSTIYAGPAALGRARGWSILARTGLMPGQATEVMLLPSRANSSFLLVQPIGPFSVWQRLSGTVYSAGAGSFNLTTGAFARTGAAVNQLALYSTDVAAMATIRATPGLIDAASAQ